MTLDGISKFLRLLGIYVHFVCVILFLVAMGTVNWTNVKDFKGEAGLWQYCDLHINNTLAYPQSDNATVGSAGGGASTQSGITSTTLRTTTVLDKEKEEDDSNDCSSFGVVGIDSYLHGVRLMIILALFGFAYGFCKGTTIKVKIEYDPSFYRQHLGELLSLVGGTIALISLEVYRGGYKTDSTILPYLKGLRGPQGEQEGDLLEIGWSANLLRVAMIMLIIAVTCMLMPTLSEKLCSNGGSRIGRSASRRSRGTSSFNLRARLASLKRDFRSEPLGSIIRFFSHQEAPQTHQPRADTELEVTSRDAEATLGDHTLALQRRHSNGSSTLSDISELGNRTSVFVISQNTSDPAPRYEDLAPPDSSIMPPPPSYDDVLKGLYITTTPPNMSSEALPPPPPYTGPTNPLPLPPPHPLTTPMSLSLSDLQVDSRGANSPGPSAPPMPVYPASTSSIDSEQTLPPSPLALPNPQESRGTENNQDSIRSVSSSSTNSDAISTSSCDAYPMAIPRAGSISRFPTRSRSPSAPTRSYEDRD